MSPGGSVTLIRAFEVPPEADAEFLAAWASAPDDAATLHRALRSDVALRYVAVGGLDVAGAGPSYLAAIPFASHAGRYEVVHEDGTPEGPGGTVLINPFEVPEGEDERFLAVWAGARELLAGQRGYLGTRLLRSLAPADFRFVNLARWSSPLMFARAIQRPEFEPAAAAMPFRSHAALYLAAGEDGR